MLSAPDAELVRRDPAVPGLGLLLDAQAFIHALRARVPEATAVTATIKYIRYKPATNCLVGYRLETANEELEAHAVAYRPDLRDKLHKANERLATRETLGAVFDDCAVTVAFFPYDGRLKALARWADPRRRKDLLRKLLPARPELWEAEIEKLRYKPQRRFVGRLVGAEGAQAALKLYTKHDYAAARVNAHAIEPVHALPIAQLLGSSERYQALAFEWLPGRMLSEIVAGSADHEASAAAGAALARLHLQDPPGLKNLTRDTEAKALAAVAAGIGDVYPPLAARAAALAGELAARLMAAPASEYPIHGDFYAQQVLVADGQVGMLDFDRACRGDPAADLGNFIAHLEREALEDRLSGSSAELAKIMLLEGYRETSKDGLPARIALYTAAGLLRLAPEPFRRHAGDWPVRIETILARAEAIAAALNTFRAHQAPLGAGRTATGTSGEIRASAAIDPQMPFLSAALDPANVRRKFQEHLPRLANGRGHLQVNAIRVVRHKPGRRCLIEYNVELARPNTSPEALTLLGKVRAKGLDEPAYRLLASLWSTGFDDAAEDSVSVPEPIALVPPFQMWLQRKVPGTIATVLLPQPRGIALAEHIAMAAHKLHRSNAPTQRRHTMTDELGILRDRLARVAEWKPVWASRLTRVMKGCERLGAAVSQTTPCGIHRDFYPDQIIVDGPRLYLLDLDLYCLGDPSLDIGNFLGHLTEQALRTLGDPDALADREAALEQRFLALSNAAAHSAVQTYKTLTLARHIFISTQIAGRRAFTEPLLELCEQRLCGAANRTPAMPGGIAIRQTC